MVPQLLQNPTIPFTFSISTNVSNPTHHHRFPHFSFLNKCSRKFISLHLFPFKSSPNLKISQAKSSGRSPEFAENGFLGMSDSDVPVELCEIRTLSPSVTLGDAVEKIKEAIQNLKLNPLSSKSGILRFQVAVPAGVEALNWLACQPQPLQLLPQIYISRKNYDIEPHDSVPLYGMQGVAGIGAAICFMGPCSLQVCRSIKRFLSVDSPLIRAYGFVCPSCDMEPSTQQHSIDSFNLFIPQVELNEFGSISFIAATLAWDESLCHTLPEAVLSLESALCQTVYHVPLSRDACCGKWRSFAHANPDIRADANAQLVLLSGHSNLRKDTEANHLALVFPLSWGTAPSSYQFYFRLSISTAFARNMFDDPRGFSCFQDYSNINAVWASLIVEECCRLGLTYFCIAPGSRSSPLAIAAAEHPLATCISCFDERSLAFHSVGYARGSYIPAVVITSSGTAVSNLLPAVVEANHDFIPLLLLTADRPPELQDAGANQAIKQVDHFGSFVRFFFSLPPPTDHIPARMILTTIDSAVYNATQTPYGPVHINCPFREPLEDTPVKWTLSCLKGLDSWISGTESFTKYIRLPQSLACLHKENIHIQVKEIAEIIKCATRGFLIIGAIRTEDEIWAALLLAKHLHWPVFADILSGLRLRKVFTVVPEIEKYFLFIDHFDHILLADSLKDWAMPDVVVQIGSKLTSKRICQMLERCSPNSYILVDSHPFRHDPSHIVTHRIQATITDFLNCILKFQFQRKMSKWSSWLQVLNRMVGEEISFQIHSESSLTEPYVALVISEALDGDSALFIGNSMVIRDADMYACGWFKSTAATGYDIWRWGPLCREIRVAGNRGASGIDGLLSTAIGFAVGCKKHVLLVIGDVSFLHDTNGLAILNQRTWRKPMTILVINNHGGAIFSLLPIAARTQSNILDQFFYTSHNISIGKLCEAHRVKHLEVRTKQELQHALCLSQREKADCVIEVQSCIDNNATFHRFLQQSASQAANNALRILSRFSSQDHISNGVSLFTIQKMDYSLYRIQLCAPLTSSMPSNDCKIFYRQGFILTISLENGSLGIGEVAPIEIHKEDLLDVEEQLRFLIHQIQGVDISCLLLLFNGSFSSWIWGRLGIQPSSIFPSVRCGLEMAILNALAATQGSNMSAVLLGCGESPLTYQSIHEDQISQKAPRVQISALVDSSGTLKEVAHVVAQLVEEGFNTIKLKVARRANPVEDAAVVQEIRQKVGYQIKIRADANRRWLLEEAIQFGLCVKCYSLEYIEEPVRSEVDIIRFFEETGLPVALDETIDNIQGDPLGMLSEFVHPGIVAVVIKPSVVGGFENSSLIAKWAQQHGKMAVLSGAFESSISLASYIQFAHYLEQKNIVMCRIRNKEPGFPISHGLGTYRWLSQDVTTKPLEFFIHPHGDTLEASVQDAANLLQNFEINHKIVQRKYSGQKIDTYELAVHCGNLSLTLELLDTGTNKEDNKLIIFLHGFLGTGEDWVPIMKAISATRRCISINLPGHGKSRILRNINKKNMKQEQGIPFEVLVDVLNKVILDITPGKVILVGYSMGARIALYMALRCCSKIAGAVIISGSPGLRDTSVRRLRAAKDDAKASSLSADGLQRFMETWYAGELWTSLRSHPQFEEIFESRKMHDDVHALARALSDFSVGRQPSLWEDLKLCKSPLLFIVGEKDEKFKNIAKQMCSEIATVSESIDGQPSKGFEMVVVPDCGHAVHLESPLPVIHAVRKFLDRIELEDIC